MNEKLENFYFNKEEPNRSCFLALREIILQHDTHITETVKYGMPCFCYNNKALCYLWKDKKTTEPYILMVDGQQLDHPDLEKGDRARMKIFRIDPEKDLPIHKIESVLNMGIAFKKGKH